MAFDQRLQRFVFSQRNNAWRWNVSRVAVSDHMFTTTNAWFTFPWVLREKNCARTFSKQTTTNLLRKKYSSEKYEFVRRFCWKVEGPGRGWGAENKIIKGGKGFCRFHGDIVLLPKKKKNLACSFVRHNWPPKNAVMFYRSLFGQCSSFCNR